MRTRAELLLFIHMDYTKQPLDYPQILQMLKERGLIVRDEIEALHQLNIIIFPSGKLYASDGG